MTYLDAIIMALKNLGGTGKYKDIYKEYSKITNRQLTDGIKAGIRKTIEDYSSDSQNFKGIDIFYSVEGLGKGIWGIRDIK